MEDQSVSERRECFGKAIVGTNDTTQEAADHNSEKCIGCLDRGPCIRSQDVNDDSGVQTPETTGGS